jgi:hypothetical protein
MIYSPTVNIRKKFEKCKPRAREKIGHLFDGVQIRSRGQAENAGIRLLRQRI